MGRVCAGRWVDGGGLGWVCDDGADGADEGVDCAGYWVTDGEGRATERVGCEGEIGWIQDCLLYSHMYEAWMERMAEGVLFMASHVFANFSHLEGGHQ